MQIKLTGVPVADQETALQFYTVKLGFIKKQYLPVGEFRFFTVVSPEDPEGPVLKFELNTNPVGLAYRRGYLRWGPLSPFFLSRTSGPNMSGCGR